MLEIELDQPVGIAVFEGFLLVDAALGRLAHKLTHAQVATIEQGRLPFQPLAHPNELVTQHMLVDRADQDSVVIFSGTAASGFPRALFGWITWLSESLRTWRWRLPAVPIPSVQSTGIGHGC